MMAPNKIIDYVFHIAFHSSAVTPQMPTKTILLSFVYLYFKNRFKIFIGNRRLWIVRLNTKISTEEGSIPVKLASEPLVSADLNSILKPLFEIVGIHTSDLETEVELKCLNNPTTEFIQNGGVPNLLQRIIERDPILRIFPAKCISKITVKAVVSLKHLGN